MTRAKIFAWLNALPFWLQILVGLACAPLFVLSLPFWMLFAIGGMGFHALKDAFDDRPAVPFEPPADWSMSIQKKTPPAPPFK